MVHFKGHKLPHDFHPLSLEGWSVLAGHAWRLKTCSHAIIQHPGQTSMQTSISLRLRILVFLPQGNYTNSYGSQIFFRVCVCVNDVCPQAQPPWLWSKSKNTFWATSQPWRDIEYVLMTVPEMHLPYLECCTLLLIYCIINWLQLRLP